MDISPTDKIPIAKYKSTYGELYEAGGTAYLFNEKPLVKPHETVRRTLKLGASHIVHDQTEALRNWTTENNLPSPKDTADMHCYVMTIDDAQLPVIWPGRSYFRSHKAISTDAASTYTPGIVYLKGTDEMCRFGHIKKRTQFGDTHCYRCKYWREKGVDLSAYKPTHCLKGHALKNNRWLYYRPEQKNVKVREACVRCHNEDVMKKTGYKPND